VSRDEELKLVTLQDQALKYVKRPSSKVNLNNFSFNKSCENVLSCFCFIPMKLSNFRLCRSTSVEVGVRASIFTIMVTLVINLYLTGIILFCLICLHIGKILEALNLYLTGIGPVWISLFLSLCKQLMQFLCIIISLSR
jgi:hypothetical protein